MRTIFYASIRECFATRWRAEMFNEVVCDPLAVPPNRPLLALTISLTVLNDGDDLWSADDVQRGHVEKKYLAIIHSACAFTRIFYSWYIRMRCQIAAAARAEKLWKMCWQKVDGGCMRDANGDLWLLNNVEKCWENAVHDLPHPIIVTFVSLLLIDSHQVHHLAIFKFVLFWSCENISNTIDPRRILTFDVDDVLPNLRSDLDVRNKLNEIVNGVDRGMNWLEALDLLSNGVRVVDNRLKLGSRRRVIVVYCHIYFLMRLSEMNLRRWKTFFSSFRVKVSLLASLH